MKKFLRYLELLLPSITALGASIVVAILFIFGYFTTYSYAFAIRSSIDSQFNYSILELLEYLLINLSQFVIARSDVVMIITQLTWILIFGFWYWGVIQKHSNRQVGRTEIQKVKLFTIKNMVILALIAFACQVVIGGAMELILPHFETIYEDYIELMESFMGGNPILVFISVVILAPFSEELIFRGVTMKKGLLIAPAFVIIIIQALLFALFHMNIVQGIYTIPAGLIMGYIAYWYRSIKASILLHMFFNGLSYIVFIPENDLFMVLYMVGAFAILVLALREVRKVGVKKELDDMVF